MMNIMNQKMNYHQGDPTTFDEAVKHEVWRKAMDHEIESIESNDTWELTELPSGSKKIGVKWIYKTKLNEKGKVEKYKARLIAKGYSQQYGIYFKEVFAPVARRDTIRTVLSIAASKSWILYQLDVKSAFLHGELNEDVYVDQSLGYQKGKKNQVYKLKKVEGKILIVSLYVDDLIYTGNDDELIRDFKRSMKRNFAMTDLGKMRYFLGVEVTQNDRGIFINQQKYAAKILTRFNMDSYNFVCSPIVPATRPDLCYSVCLIARYMERPTEIHLAAAKRILRYLKGTINYGVLYDKGSLNMKLEGWTDSDYAGDNDDRKSTSSYVFKLGYGEISWSSKKQPIVTLSTTEAEYVAAASRACQGVWLGKILQQLGQKQEKSSTIYCDNNSSIKLSKIQSCMADEQIADIMTKPLKLESFVKLRSKLGVCDAFNSNNYAQIRGAYLRSI
ncbi:retrotransposon-related protein [Trifolium pratense]|uniref:Retrotransposon-related protein n=1 Tax=Trifolium pratense TaxID=57577 RepID=A0A2K3N6U7_TRIPR|nr:retrotransposon-related protein [Trifolium pratense]